MKRIKTYKLFESTETNIREDIKDIFLELKDEGFDVYVAALNHLDPKDVAIKKGATFNGTYVDINTFLLEDVYEYILTCRSYLKEKGFTITDIKAWAKVVKDGATILTGPETNFNLDDNIALYESDPEENKLFDKPLIKLEFKIRKEN